MFTELPSTPHGRRLSLLVLDGGPHERASLCSELSASGIELSFAEARDAAVALELVQRGRYDCVLLDQRAAGADGVELLRVAQADELPVPLIVLAARVDERRAVELLKAGAADYITAAGLSGERLRQSVVQAVRVRRAEVAAASERRRLARLQHFAAVLAAQRTVAEVAESTVAEVLRAFRAPRALFAVTGEGERLELLEVRGFSEALVEQWRQLPLDAPLPLTDATRLATPLFFEDSRALFARYPALAADRVAGDEALFVLPLVVERRSIGTLVLIYDTPRHLSQDDREELIAFAGVCAQALDRAYLFDLAQRERRRAEEANRAKDQFLAVVSHELRTPLNAILGWAKMLNAGSLSPEQTRKATATIERNATAQAQLIDDLLDVSRIITGQMRIKAEPVDLAAVIEAALDIVRPAADAKGVRLQQDFDPSLGPLLGDADRLQQVFWNLLSNAVKFTPRGGRVAVRLSRAGSSCLVEVQDSGQGIPADFIPLMFQRFRQHDASTARKTGGLGLGLAIVRHLVELHGGSVDVASEGLGHGSTLSVRLPINVALERDASQPSPVSERCGAAPRADTAAALEGVRVLVVDDDPDARDLVASVLAERRARVTAVGSAGEAFARVAADPPDVLVSDIGMPIEDGYELMERVRALPPESGGRIPAIALTAYAQNSDRARALLAGYTAHATKPIDPDQLVEIVVSVAGRVAAP